MIIAVVIFNNVRSIGKPILRQDPQEFLHVHDMKVIIQTFSGTAIGKALREHGTSVAEIFCQLFNCHQRMKLILARTGPAEKGRNMELSPVVIVDKNVAV